MSIGTFHCSCLFIVLSSLCLLENSSTTMNNNSHKRTSGRIKNVSPKSRSNISIACDNSSFISDISIESLDEPLKKLKVNSDVEQTKDNERTIETNDAFKSFINLKTIDLNRLGCRYGQCISTNLWLNSNIITSYFCLKILSDDYNRNNNINRILYIDPSIWLKPLNVEMTYWGTSRRNSRTCLLTIPKYLKDWEYVYIPIHVNMNHWILGIGNRFSSVIIYDTLGSKYQIYHERLQNIMNLVGGGLCMITYAKCGVDFQKQIGIWECEYHCLIIAEKHSIGDSNLFHDIDYILKWREHAYNFLSNVIKNSNNDTENVFTFNDYETSDISIEVIDQLHINETIDDNYFIAFESADLSCLTVDYHECMQNYVCDDQTLLEDDVALVKVPSMKPMWLTANIISAFFCLKILPEHRKSPNWDNILFVNPGLWRSLAGGLRTGTMDDNLEIVSTIEEIAPATIPNCWHTYEDVNKIGISTFPIYLDNWDRVFVPVHENENHWTLAVLFRATKRIEYYDTLRNERNAYIENMLKLISRLLGSECDEIVYPNNYLRQEETFIWQCGPNVCLLIESIVKGETDLFYELDEVLAFRTSMHKLIVRAMNFLDKIVNVDSVTAEQLFVFGTSILTDDFATMDVYIAELESNEVGSDISVTRQKCYNSD